MTGPQPQQAQPAQASPAASQPAQAQPQPSQPAQLGVALVDTPAGQRLAVQLTLCLTADEARSFAEGIAGIAASMSTAGLIIANGALHSDQVR